MLIGLNFDLKKLMMTGEQGRVEVPINQFGGRFGVLGDPATYMSHDDGTRVAGGLNLVVTYQKTGGVYTLDATIERGFTPGAIGFGESEEPKTVAEEITEALLESEAGKQNSHDLLMRSGFRPLSGKNSLAAYLPMPDGYVQYRSVNGTGKEFITLHKNGWRNLTGKTGGHAELLSHLNSLKEEEVIIEGNFPAYGTQTLINYGYDPEIDQSGRSRYTHKDGHSARVSMNSISHTDKHGFKKRFYDLDKLRTHLATTHGHPFGKKKS
jgi:hypothetical protein